MSNKHDANVRKSTLVNFQIGLVASLLFTYVMFEVYTQVPIVNVEEPTDGWVDETPYVIGDIQVYKEPKKDVAVVKKPKKPSSFVEPKIAKPTEEIDGLEEALFETPEHTGTTGEDPVIEDLPPVENIEYDFKVVEFVPVYPGCEDLPSNKETAQCFSDKIKRLVSRKFNTDMAADLGLSGLQRIYVQFEVYKDGTIRNIKARAPHPKLEKEAVRIVKNFPKMTPGKQRGKSVTVKYSLPIVFKIAD